MQTTTDQILSDLQCASIKERPCKNFMVVCLIHLVFDKSQQAGQQAVVAQPGAFFSLSALRGPGDHTALSAALRAFAPAF
jgi:hypothetical protein